MRRPSFRSLFSRWLPVLVYAGLVSYVSSLEGLDIPGGLSDKIAHAAEFGILGALLWRAATGSFLGRPTPRRILAVVVACGAYAAIDEYHQAFVRGRESSASDAAADLAGAILFVLVLCAVSWWRRRPERIRGLRSSP